MRRNALVPTVVLFLFFGFTVQSFASIIDVTYTAAVSGDHYILDFTITNNIPSGSDQYIFGWGASEDAEDPLFPVGGWIPTGGHRMYSAHWGWVGPTGPNAIRIMPGEQRTGFTQPASNITATVYFYAEAYSPSGIGYQGQEPGLFVYSSHGLTFEGVAMNSSVPAPASLLLLGPGLVGLVGLRKRLL